mmetsp:Transcript_14766/g.33580  ORF Transcript_14766/g.33580 Transcript_14766/m.33580 type:complete len:212 (-) Transcript_14766:285-920(-)
MLRPLRAHAPRGDVVHGRQLHDRVPQSASACVDPGPVLPAVAHLARGVVCAEQGFGHSLPALRPTWPEALAPSAQHALLRVHLALVDDADIGPGRRCRGCRQVRGVRHGHHVVPALRREAHAPLVAVLRQCHRGRGPHRAPAFHLRRSRGGEHAGPTAERADADGGGLHALPHQAGSPGALPGGAAQLRLHQWGAAVPARDARDGGRLAAA